VPPAAGRGRFARLALFIGAAAVVVLGVVIIGPAFRARSPAGSAAIARISGGAQTVTTPVRATAYMPIVVQRGIPVRWILTAGQADLTSCNATIVVPRYGIRRALAPGRTVIEFTPTADGTVAFSCWMGMIRSSIAVVEDVRHVPAAAALACAVPSSEIGVARHADVGQTVEIAVSQDGYHPAVIVVQKGVPVRIHFNPVTLTSCNSVVEFPGYPATVDLAAGARDAFFPEVLADFTFRCGQGMLHGYVKVVDDTRTFDRDALRRQVDSYRPSDIGAATCCGY
jgi:uncharacterized protein